MTDLVVFQRLLLSAFLAGLIGYERERVGRAAGFRTHILVGVGSCLVMLTGLALDEQLSQHSHFDPSRMAAQVVSGIGFLGAGTILRFRASVRGLTTAASLWAVGGIGLAIGAGFFIGGILTGVIVVLSLVVLSRLERIIRKEWSHTLVVETQTLREDLAHIQKVLEDYDVAIQKFEIASGASPNCSSIRFQVKLFSDSHQEEILRELLRLEGVKQAQWM